jgi:hypothetical protein
MVYKYLNKLEKHTIPTGTVYQSTGTVYQSTGTVHTINKNCINSQLALPINQHVLCIQST